MFSFMIMDMDYPNMNKSVVLLTSSDNVYGILLDGILD